MHRSASVSGKCLIVAITFGHQHEKRPNCKPPSASSPLDSDPRTLSSASPAWASIGPRDSPFESWTLDFPVVLFADELWAFPGVIRITYAVFLAYPEFNIPFSSLFRCKTVSASSIISVGSFSSITRKNAGELMFDATTGRFTSSHKTVNNVVLPHRFSGDSTPMYVATCRNRNA